jgi:hypothetical protein
MKLRFDDLRLFQATFEIKFEHAWLLWDRSGSLWSAVVRKVPDLEMQHAEPNRVVFASTGEQESQMTAEPGRLSVVSFNPDKKLQQVTEMVSALLSSAIEMIGLTQFTRVGLRLAFTKEFPTDQEAANAVLSTGLLRVPRHEKLFGISMAPKAPEYGLHGEDGRNGFNLNLKAETIEAGFRPNFGFGVFFKPMKQTIHRVNLDVDHYLTGPVLAGQFLVTDWINQALHIVRRDGAALLED